MSEPFPFRPWSPCWSKLFYNPMYPNAIELHVHKDVEGSLYSLSDLEALGLLPSDDFFELAGKKLIAGPESDWGIDGVFKRIVCDDPNFIAFRIEPPCAKYFLEKPCDACGGSGFDDENKNHRCHWCENGHKVKYDWKTNFPYCASLQLLEQIFSPYEHGEKITSAKTPQLITFGVTMYPISYPLWGIYSPLLVAWFTQNRHLHNHDNAVAGFVINAMSKMWKKILGDDDDRIHLEIRPPNGWVNIHCPGDACGLHPANESEMFKGFGYNFTCHNMDHPGQQLTLLTALAAIETEARKELQL